MLLFGVSNRLSDPLNPANPPVSDLPPPDPTTSAVEHGFQTHKPDPTRVGCRFFLSKPVTPDPNQILSLSNELLRLSDHFWLNLVQILRDPTRSWQIQPDFGLISTALNRFRPDLARSGHISASVIKLETDPNQLETDETRTEKSEQISGSVSGQFFIHLPHSGRVRVGHKPDPTQPVDTPSYYIKKLQN